MGLLSKARTSVALNRKAEEALYEMALDEFEAGDIRRGLWAQALAEAQGNESRAKGFYLKLRVRAMQDDGAIMSESLNTARANAAPPTATPPPKSAPSEQTTFSDGDVWPVVLIFGAALIFGLILYAVFAQSGPG